MPAFPPPPNDPRAAAWDPEAGFKQNNTFYQLGLRGDIALGDKLTLTSLTSYAYFRGHLPQDFDATNYRAEVTTIDGKISSLSQELRLSGAAGDRTKWMVGGKLPARCRGRAIQLRSGIEFRRSYRTFNWNSFLIGNNQDVLTRSAFGSLDFVLNDAFTAQIAARYTDQDRNYTGCTRDDGNGQIAAAFSFLSSMLTGVPQTIPPGACVTLNNDNTPAPIIKAPLDQSNVSWRAGLNWKPDTSTMLYGNVTKGFKAGSFETSGQATAGQNTGCASRVGYCL